MSLQKTSNGLWRSPLLDAQAWLDHAFGTAAVSPPFDSLLLQQVHGVKLVLAGAHFNECEGDGLMSAIPGQFVAVKTADCIPLLLADPRNQAVAAVHGGWRGTAAGIAREAVVRMKEQFGTNAEDLIAAAGPCIRHCCFEVGPEVAIQFQDWFPERSDLQQRTRLDLIEVTRRQLTGSGVRAGNIDLDGPCTVCGGAEFHSWRRDKRTGARMFSSIGVHSA